MEALLKRKQVLTMFSKKTVFCVSGFLKKIYKTNFCSCGWDGNVILSYSNLIKPYFTILCGKEMKELKKNG